MDSTFEKIEDQLTDIMGFLSQLWIMIENVNTNTEENAPEKIKQLHTRDNKIVS